MMDQPTHIIDPDGEVIIILRDANSPFAQAPGDTVAGMTVSYSDHSLQSPAEAIKPPPTYSGKQKKKKKSRKGLRAIRSSSEPVSSPASPPIEEPAAEDPAAEDPVAEEPAAEEPAAEDPAAEDPAAEEPAAGEPAEEQVYEPLVKIQVSAKHLIFASSVFKRILTGGWKESTIYLQKGSVEITAESWDIGALLILLHAIHGKYRRIPRKLTLEMLAKVAVIADYYECKESVYSMTDIWINNLEEKIPMTYSRNLILWLWVSWFFQLSSQFKETTSAVMSLSKTYVHGWGLPISHEVIGLMNKRRHEAINHSVFRLHEIRDALLSGSRGCEFECRSIMLGALTIQMQSSNLLSPRPAAPFLNLSHRDLIQKVLAFESPEWSTSAHYQNHYGYIQAHTCADSSFKSLFANLNDFIEGLDLNDFIEWFGLNDSIEELDLNSLDFYK